MQTVVKWVHLVENIAEPDEFCVAACGVLKRQGIRGLVRAQTQMRMIASGCHAD